MGRPDGDPREAPGRLPFMPPSDKRVRPVEVRALKAEVNIDTLQFTKSRLTPRAERGS